MLWIYDWTSWITRFPQRDTLGGGARTSEFAGRVRRLGSVCLILSLCACSRLVLRSIEFVAVLSLLRLLHLLLNIASLVSCHDQNPAGCPANPLEPFGSAKRYGHW